LSRRGLEGSENDEKDRYFHGVVKIDAGEAIGPPEFG